jgi:HAD superfamily hydrolase (TIGR01509 family)
MYKKWIEGKKVVCFDLDGTIVDTVNPAFQAFANILHLVNPDIKPNLAYGVVGESTYEKWARLADAKLIKNNVSVKDLTENTHKEFLRLISENPLEPKEGFWDLVYKLKEEKGLKLALATNTAKSVAMQVINKAEISEVFDFMIFGDEIKKPKPNAEIYIKVIKHFGIKPQEMLVFEDSLLGVSAAYKAGSPIVVIWDGNVNRSRYPKGMLTFTPDFEGIAENLDFTVDEALAELRKNMGINTQPQQSQPTQTQS